MSSSSSGLSDPIASSSQASSLIESPKSEKDAQRKKKKKERNKLIRMMEQDAERRERFDGSFREEEGISQGWQQAFAEASGETLEVSL